MSVSELRARELVKQRDAEIVALRAEVERLREALREYGWHIDNCTAFVEGGYPCSCGFDAALKRAGPGKGE